MAIAVNILALPADGGQPITDIEYRVNEGAAVSLGQSTTGTYPIVAIESDSIQIRAVNSVGAGAWSDTKTLAGAAPEFILQMQTTTASETITLPIAGTVAVDIDWGDGGAIETFSTESPSHEYATAGTHDIKITGSCTTFAFNNGGDRLKLLAVLNGGTGFTAGSWANGFFGCTNLVSADFKGLNTSEVLSMASMFNSCTNLTTLDVSGFNTVIVSSMFRMLRSCPNLTSDPGIHAFNVTALTNAGNMCGLSNNMLSTAEYNTILTNWEAQAVKNNVPAHFGDATHSGAGSTARAALVLPVIDGGHGWLITDGGAAP